MKKLQRLGLSGLLIGLLSQINCVQKHPSDQNLTTLIEAERSFAHTSQTAGMRKAFLTFLADDAIVFRPRPIKGKSLYNQSSTNPGILTWRPIFADISVAGDLGYTTGPFEFRRAGGDGQPDGYGHYVSLWKRQSTGEWQVVLDAGISHAAPDSTWITPITMPERQSSKIPGRFKRRTDTEKKAIPELERRFSLDSSGPTGFRTALQSFCTANARIYRNNHLPGLSSQSAASILETEPDMIRWEAPTVEISASGDLAYTYGMAESIPIPEGSSGKKLYSFLRIWKKSGKDTWKIVLDLANPIPPALNQKSAAE